ncbi:MAG: phosphoethanolamine transferase [Bacteriovoracaceae bacterium]|nr:phosphoethanolamine transferase [Bacteriovoracaceae bacterium]
MLAFNFLQKIRGNLLWALMVWAFTLIQQMGFQIYKGIPFSNLPAGKYVLIYFFFLLFSFIRPKGLRYLFSTFIMILAFMQMGHLSYYGTQALPIEIWLLFAQFNEVSGTLVQETYHLGVPLLFTLPFMLVLYFTQSRLKFVTLPWLSLILSLSLTYYPLRTLLTGNNWGRQPTDQELYGMNVYLSISYFLGKILPLKMNRNHASDHKPLMADSLEIIPANSSYQNVILVLGESLTPNHQSLFGYERDTTPFLKSQKTNPHFAFNKAISSGVSTDITIAFFMNATYGVSGSGVIAQGKRCLFKKARESGFKNYFFSSQSQQQLRYIIPMICHTMVDELKTFEDIPQGDRIADSADDKELIKLLKARLNEPGKKFFVLHQRGSHGPYALRSDPDKKIFKAQNERVDDYDNSVLEFDRFMQELSIAIKSHEKDTLMIYLSDHGEGLGEMGVWGHGALKEPSYLIPFLMMTRNAKEIMKQHFAGLKNITAFNIEMFLLKMLGYKTSIQSNQEVLDFQIYGNDIDGLAGKKELTSSEAPYAHQ